MTKLLDKKKKKNPLVLLDNFPSNEKQKYYRLLSLRIHISTYSSLPRHNHIDRKQDNNNNIK